jgi:hypothetical protein
MSVLDIKFDNYNYFSGISTTPYVTKNLNSVFNGAYSHLETEYSFNGQITGRSFTEIKTKVDKLLTGFTGAFFTGIKIGETFDECCHINSISIDGSNYVGMVPYTLNLTCYGKNNFTFYGVRNISRQISFSETKDKKIEISHNISAQGIRTSGVNNALNNAINFVNNFTGNLSNFGPFYGSVATPILLTQREQINPLDATCSVSETYIIDESGTGPILRYTIDIKSGIDDGNVEMNVNGTAEGGRTYNLSQLQTRVGDVDLTNKPFANSETYNLVGLDFNYKSNENILSFTKNYSNDGRITSNTIVDFGVDIERDFLTDFQTIKFNGKVTPTIDLDFSNVSGVFNSEFNVTTTKINNLLNLNTTIFKQTYNTKPNIRSISYDQNNAQISVDEEYDNIERTYKNLVDINYSIKISPAIQNYRASPILNDKGGYYIENIKYNKRKNINIDGSAVVDNSMVTNPIIENEIKEFLNKKIVGKYLTNLQDLILNSQNISFNLQANLVNFTFEYTCEDTQNLFTDSVFYPALT